ncbi:rab-GTPase-TBC domain-domain-containing protein [Kockovaella imperatae]|uniref:Rab-GTPase-TBC domain-domain-containing protein n=1 Tax=Kockovaella imperatae TaxID=4999 RepID=A0A1Y1UKX2_9TREE|nr:rab-GTPase-TBC domain-domain-containing protein [Kockovaella imperatae]ORX38703.1 rab-GTPase-TBC domain-domain-containing protein [Kockovaella imperatae]
MVDPDLLGARQVRKASGDEIISQGKEFGRQSRRGSTTKQLLSAFTDEELDIVGTRYDLMDQDEIQQLLEPFSSADISSSFSRMALQENDLGFMETPRARRPSTTKSLDPAMLDRSDTSGEPNANGRPNSSTPPLFPPSPPPLARARRNHPLQVLSRAIRELEDTVASLILENEVLQAQLAAVKPCSIRTDGQQNALHDDISEALGTSLTSPSPLKPSSSRPLPEITHTQSVPPPSRSRFPALSPDQSSKSVPLTEPAKSAKATWTSSLWGWNGTKRQTGSAERKARRGSVSSLASQPVGTSKTLTNEPRIGLEEAMEDGDEEAWRKGDGGSTPSLRAIVNATRILTPDPSSVLDSSAIPPNSLVAYLAHSLVSNARDEGLVSKVSTERRTSKSRARATSIASQESQRSIPVEIEPPVSAESTKSYGDQARAVGRSLLSSVSHATIRGTKAMSAKTEDVARPATLARTMSRPFLGNVSSPPLVNDMRPSPSSTSPQDETPPPSVELASIIPDEARPPTVLLSRQNLGSFFRASEVGKVKLSTASRFQSSEPPLTDRYGFIYDIQHAKLLKDASVAGAAAAASLNGTIPSSQPEGWVEKRRAHRQKQVGSAPTPDRPSSRSSIKSPIPTHTPDASTPRSKTPDSLYDLPPSIIKHDSASRHRSLSTVAALNPSPAKPSLAKDHLTVSVRGSTSLGTTSDALTTHSELPPSPQTKSMTPANSDASSAAASRATVSSLLDQLTDIHDRQQKERMVEWAAFLKHRAKTKISQVEGRKGSEEMIWGSGLVGFNELNSNHKHDQEDRKTFFKLVRRGIPLIYRNDIWAECSGARDMMIPGEYTEVLKKHRDEKSPVQAEIEKDITRTFPGNLFFGGDGHGVPKLRNVLLAYSWHNPSVGYCQGMNMLAATLLLTHPDEEQAYWTLVAIVERLLPAAFFSPDLHGSRVDQMVLDDLVAQYAPKVHAKLVELGIDLASITFGWFLSLFTDCLPVETLFRVWDVFFVEGHDALFRIALAILKLNEPDLLAADSVSDLFAIINGTTSRLWTADKLIALQHGYKAIIRHEDIQARFDAHASAT